MNRQTGGHLLLAGFIFCVGYAMAPESRVETRTDYEIKWIEGPERVKTVEKKVEVPTPLPAVCRDLVGTLDQYFDGLVTVERIVSDMKAASTQVHTAAANPRDNEDYVEAMEEFTRLKYDLSAETADVQSARQSVEADAKECLEATK